MFQKTELIGRVANIETMSTKSQTTVCRFSVATDRSVKQADGSWEKETEWHSVVAFAKTAEQILQNIQKGDLIRLEGELRTSKWEKDGHKFQRTEIIVARYPMKLPSQWKKQDVASVASNAPTTPQVDAAAGMDIPF